MARMPRHRAESPLKDDALRYITARLSAAAAVAVSFVGVSFKVAIDNFSNQVMIDVYNSIIAPIIVAIIVGLAGWVFAVNRAEKIYRQKIKSAPKKYVEELEKLIRRGVDEGIEKSIINARAIVATRNSLRQSLVAISAQLNSQIDRLAIEIGESNVNPAGPTIESLSINIDKVVAYDRILVLERIWPSKKVQIEYEIRKLLAELGLEPDLSNSAEH